MRKIPFRHTQNVVNEAQNLNENLSFLERYRLESVLYRTSASASVLFPAQELESGRQRAVGTGTSSVVVTIPLQQRYNSVLGCNLTPIGISWTARISDVTASSLAVQLDATASLGTAAYEFFWELRGRLE